MQSTDRSERGAAVKADAPHRFFWTFGLLLVPIAGAIVPTEVIESGPIICLFRLLAGWECWGCGMTRAISAMLHGEVRQAMAFNWRVVFVFPLLVLAWSVALWQIWLPGRSFRRG